MIIIKSSDFETFPSGVVWCRVEIENEEIISIYEEQGREGGYKYQKARGKLDNEKLESLANNWPRVYQEVESHCKGLPSWGFLRRRRLSRLFDMETGRLATAKLQAQRSQVKLNKMQEELNTL